MRVAFFSFSGGGELQVAQSLSHFLQQASTITLINMVGFCCHHSSFFSHSGVSFIQLCPWCGACLQQF